MRLAGGEAAHVSEGEERTVKKEHYAEHHEECAERGQPDADFWQQQRVLFFLECETGRGKEDENYSLCMSVNHIVSVKWRVWRGAGR